MLTVHKFQKRGAAAGEIHDLSKTAKTWADCYEPTEQELSSIADKANIPLADLQEYLGKDERPQVSDLDNYSLIVVKVPYIYHKHILTLPLVIFVSKKMNNIITIAPHELASVHRVREQVQLNKLNIAGKGIGFLLYRLLDESFNLYFPILDTIEERIDRIEDTVVNKATKALVREIFSLKKTLIYFHKALAANREVITAIEKMYISNIDKKAVKWYRMLYNDITELLDIVSTYRDILTGTLDIYVSSVSNSLNQIMKTLTLISAFVLIPTLISGIYGMNFSKNSPWNMPELYWQYGYVFALGLMIVSIITMYFYFRKKGWIGNH